MFNKGFVEIGISGKKHKNRSIYDDVDERIHNGFMSLPIHRT